ncbi:MAG: sigma-54 dependent transcriptional regulator [candidate division KSB1 bacterium]|nr:sigma-54 dependent transcriptional regulator [candidate division KSB1 bacterium]MDZ7273360.1 sigma-54 dependent transcriptional regulator [candidate division KSB1 bacterium]MDZ7288022.1 sigma-54 dependent transcriptional regulator [candidate division KSB1 bacterium]MDZ7300126.1 sigma-54 dependent transcriptional regulator [candidate division KSB1 bacterium]MDZ7309376.1 sigma-54 dependent transcriptional regulator [candidate division KSB1 bacterium]
MLEQAKILIVEDNTDLCQTLAEVFRKSGHKVLTAFTGADAKRILKSEIIDLALLDLRLPDMLGIKVLEFAKEVDPDIMVIMMTALANDPKPAVEAMKVGAFDYLTKPFELDEVKLVVAKALETVSLKREVSRLKQQQRDKFPGTELFGNSRVMQEIKNMIRIVSETPRTSVLIQGESGTGKELVANTVHQWSSRRDKPFVPINCSAIPESLLESELFGHEKGAFTDAKTLKKGIFELADTGTIFLDEISSMRLALQPKLLRVLETQTFRRIGGTADIQIDVRLVAATNRDLQEMVREGSFREDLYYRLKVMVIVLPPLRERTEDIIPLASLFIERNNHEFNKNITGISPEAEELLRLYQWPGNVRELKNVIERAVILCQDSVLKPEHLPMELRDEKSRNSVFFAAPLSAAGGMNPPLSLEQMEKIHIQNVLAQNKGNKSRTARALNISRSTLREKMRLYQIPG